MTANILRKLGVGEAYFTSEFEYVQGRLKKEGALRSEGERQYHGHSFKPTPESEYVYAPRPFTYVRVKEGEESDPGGWRRAEDPHEIGGQLGILALTNPFVYLLTTCKRVIEAVSIVASLFFDVFIELYSQKATDNLSNVYLISLKECLKVKSEDFKKLGKEIRKDLYCASVMEVAAVRGFFNADEATRMQFLFADAEKRWNGDLNFEETSNYAASLVSSAIYQIRTPQVWIYMVNTCKRDDDAVGSLLRQRFQYSEGVKSLEAAVDRERHTLASNAEFQRLGTVINQSEEFMGMSTVQLIDSAALKRAYFRALVNEMAETNRRGFVQYQCAYPYSAEKRGRIEEFDKSTVRSTISEAKEALRKSLL